MRKELWDRHGGKNCKLLEGNVQRKVVSTSKETILGRDQGSFAAVLSKMDLSDVGIVKYVIGNY